MNTAIHARFTRRVCILADSQAIAIPVKALAMGRGLHVVVGAKEATQAGVVHPAVHVDQLKKIDMLVTGKTAGSGCGKMDSISKNLNVGAGVAALETNLGKVLVF